MSDNGNSAKATMDAELKAIRRMTRVIEGLTLPQKQRVVQYVQQTLWDQVSPPTLIGGASVNTTV